MRFLIVAILIFATLGLFAQGTALVAPSATEIKSQEEACFKSSERVAFSRLALDKFRKENPKINPFSELDDYIRKVMDLEHQAESLDMLSLRLQKAAQARKSRISDDEYKSMLQERERLYKEVVLFFAQVLVANPRIAKIWQEAYGEDLPKVPPEQLLKLLKEKRTLK